MTASKTTAKSTKGLAYTIGDQAVSASPTSRKPASRTTAKGAARAASTRKRVDTNAAKVAQINADTAKVAELVKQARKPIEKRVRAEITDADRLAKAAKADDAIAARKAAAAKPVTQKLSVLDPNEADAWSEVHAEGCNHLNRSGKWGIKRGANSYPLSAATLTEAAEDIASDFIAEGSMTVEDALANIHFAPCVKLPLTAETKTATKPAAKPAVAKSESKPQDETRSVDELASTLRGPAVDQAAAITKTAKQLQSLEAQIAAEGLNARNQATADSPKVHKDRDAAIRKLVELEAGHSYIARVRRVAMSTHRGLWEMMTVGKRS